MTSPNDPSTPPQLKGTMAGSFTPANAGPLQGPPPGGDGHGAPPTSGGPGQGQADDPSRRWWLIPALVAGLVAGTVGGFLGANAVLHDGPDRDVATVRLVPADEPGDDPFTPDMSSITAADREAARSAGARLALPTSGRSAADLEVISVDAVAGDSPVYGDGAGPVCDVGAMAEALEADDGARSVWTELMDVGDHEVATALQQLVPLVLTRDTAVTNTSYVGGEASMFQAVLEAGTPVLVDGTGVPRVVCSCTNPVLPPELPERARLVGPRWEGFDETAVITVAPGDEGLVDLPVVDLRSGEERTIRISTGPTVELDGYLVDDATGVYVVSEDGATRTLVVDRPVAAVFDDGAGGLIYQHERTTSGALMTRQQTIDRPPETADAAIVWHLPGGETEPVALLGSDDPARRWFSLQDVSTTASGPKVAYYEMVGPSECDRERGCASFESTAARLLDLETSEVIDFGFGASSSTRFRVGRTSVAYAWVANDHGFLHRSTLDGVQLDSSCEIDCGAGFRDVIDDDQWAGLTYGYDDLSLIVCGYTGSGSCDEVPLAGYHDSAGMVEFVAVEGDHVIVSVVDDSNTAAAVYDVDLSGDEDPVSILATNGRTRVLSAPLLRPAAASSSGQPPTTAPPASLARIVPDGYGPLRLGMSLAEAQATGWVTEDTTSCGELLFGSSERNWKFRDPEAAATGVLEMSEGRVVAIFLTSDPILPDGTPLDMDAAGWDVRSLVEATGGTVGEQTWEDRLAAFYTPVSYPGGERFAMFLHDEGVTNLGIPGVYVCD